MNLINHLLTKFFQHGYNLKSIFKMSKFFAFFLYKRQKTNNSNSSKGQELHIYIFYIPSSKKKQQQLL